jgi:hypothetical protein
MSQGLPPKLEELMKSGSKKKLRFVLFRLPKDMKTSDLNGLELDLTDLKVTSVGSDLKAVPDMQTDPERGSACVLLPDADGKSMKCGKPFVSNIQIIRVSHSNKRRNQIESLPASSHAVKQEPKRKLKKIKSEN